MPQMGYNLTKLGEDAIIELWEGVTPWRVGNAKDIHTLEAVYNFSQFSDIAEDLKSKGKKYTHRQIINSLRHLRESGYIAV